MTLAILGDRSGPNDARLAHVILENLEKNYPDHDGDRFRIRSKLAELRGRFSGRGGAPGAN